MWTSDPVRDAERHFSRPAVPAKLVCSRCGAPLHFGDRYYNFQDDFYPICPDCLDDYLRENYLEVVQDVGM